MRKTRPTTATTFTPAERRNWGYWDGVAARERNRHPEWCRSWQTRPAHPFDKPYGVAFWAGWYGEAHPNTGTVPNLKQGLQALAQAEHLIMGAA